MSSVKSALGGKPVTLETLSTLSQRDIWIMSGYGRKTSNEIRDWAARHDVDMPDQRPLI